LEKETIRKEKRKAKKDVNRKGTKESGKIIVQTPV